MGVAEREEPLMYETALAGSIPQYTIHVFIGSSCQVRYVSYIGLRIVVTNVVEGLGYSIEFPVLSGDINLCNWREKVVQYGQLERRGAQKWREKEKEKLQETSQSQSREEMKNFLHLDSPQSIPGFFISTVGVEDRKKKLFFLEFISRSEESLLSFCWA